MWWGGEGQVRCGGEERGGEMWWRGELFCNPLPFWGRNVLLSEAIYHVSYAREPRNCLFIDVVMNLTL